MSELQPPQVFDEAAMHKLLQDVEIVVRKSYDGAFDKKTAIEGLLTIPCRDAGHSNYKQWQGQFTPVTFDLDSATLLVLVDVTEHPFNHGPDMARFMSALASELTAFFSTPVAPAQRSVEQNHLTAPSGRQFVEYKFLLMDKPASLPAWY